VFFLSFCPRCFTRLRGGGHSGGGGNGTSNSGNVNIGGNTVLSNEDFDSDGNGVPDVLDFNGVSIKFFKASSTGSAQTADTASVQVPAMVFFEKLNEASNPDEISVTLQAGTEYTFEFSKNLADPIEDVAPVIEILDPNQKTLEFCTDGDTDNTGKILHTIYPEENPALICLTVKPSVTGQYTVKVSGIDINTVSTAADTKDVYVLFIYTELRNENGEPGYYTRFKFPDGDTTTDTISINDIIELRRIYLEFNSNYVQDFSNGNGSDYELTTEQDKELMEWLEYMKRYYGIYDETDTTSAQLSNAGEVKLSSATSRIPTTLSGIQYNDDYTLGSGFFGITGYSAKGRAMQPITLSVPTSKNTKTYYKASFVSSQQEREKASNTTVGVSLSLGGFELKASLSSLSSYKFGLTSTTYVIHYEEVETTPRLLNDTEYKLTSEAAAQLANGYTNFRNSYGDYFVAGYTYGGTFDAYISITTETTEQLKSIKSGLEASFNSVNAKVTNETKNSIKNSGASIKIEIKTFGAGASDPITKKDADGLDSIASELQKFRNVLASASASDLAPVRVYLKRYSTLSDVTAKMDQENNDGTIPIPSDKALLIYSFNRSLMTLGSYHQVIADLEDSQIDSSVRNGYANSFQSVVQKIQTDTTFYDDDSKVKSTQEEIKKLSQELKDLGDRYAFYHMLQAAQTQEKEVYSKYNMKDDDASDEDTSYQPFGGHKGGSTGYSEFFVSTAVTNDINEGKSEELDGRQSYKAAGRRYWGTSDHNLSNVSSSYTAKTKSGSTDAAFCYVSASCENDTDCHRRFSNYPVVGKSKLDFDFKSGYSRDATWVVTYKTMSFTKEKYPFFGLSR